MPDDSRTTIPAKPSHGGWYGEGVRLGRAEAAAEIERLRAEVADLKCSVIAFGAPAMVEYARDMGLPKGHLYPSHYDILKQAGARMDSFTRAEVETHGR